MIYLKDCINIFDLKRSKISGFKDTDKIGYTNCPDSSETEHRLFLWLCLLGEPEVTHYVKLSGLNIFSIVLL
jgi:hypothetical protein